MVGEPLPLDLLNTVWMADGEPYDMLHDLAGLTIWADANGLAIPPTGRTRRNLVEARDAIRAVATDRRDQAGRERLNDVLAHGRVASSLGAGGQVEHLIEADDDSWESGVLAAYGLVDLLERTPDRIRRCDHPDCVLWFLDTSRNGTRRWCSMERCGNRAKAKRHYERKNTS
jgi:predicted RNA-binding Zn ribbon-like protein